MEKFLIFISVLSYLTSLSYAEPAPAASFTGKPSSLLHHGWPAQIRPGIRIGNARTLFFIDNFVPLFGTEDSILFLNPKIVLGSNDTNEENVGGGYRHLLFDENLILGGNFYYDSLYSKNNFRHHQLGFGAEVLMKWFDFRTNFYFPISGKKFLGDNTSYSFGQRSLIARTSSRYEEPLRGFDYEGGVLIPYLSDTIETRIYMGGYHYNSKLGDNINGIKVRVEVKPAPALTIDVEIKHDNLFHTDAYVGGYISIPFNIGNIFQGKNPFEGWQESVGLFKGSRKLRKRMTDIVIRDIDVVSLEATSTQESKVANMIYADNSNDNDSNENGSLNHPYNTLQEGVDNLTEGTWLYLFKGDGTAIGYTGNYTLPDNTTLWGEGYEAYPGLGGGGYPLIDGTGFGGDVITLGNYNTVMGFEIQNAARDGIRGGTVTGSVILNNVVHDNDGRGITLIPNGAGNYTAAIRSNTIYSNGGGGVGDAYGIMVIAYDDTVFTVTIEGNNSYSHTEGANNAGIYVGARRGQMNITLKNNNFSNNGGTGLVFGGWSGNASQISRIDATVKNNTISGNDIDGINSYFFQGYITQNFKISDNVISNNDDDGIEVDIGNGGSDKIANIDLGGGTLGSRGYNSIYSNGDNDIENDTDGEIKAENNWWGSNDDPPGNFGGAEDTDYRPWLASDPNL